jgi:hypothetical protein
MRVKCLFKPVFANPAASPVTIYTSARVVLTSAVKPHFFLKYYNL